MPDPLDFPAPRRVTQEELDRDPVLRALLAAGDTPGPIEWPWGDEPEESPGGPTRILRLDDQRHP